MVLHPAAVVRDHPKGSKYGRGLFAAAPIAKGEVVWLEDHEAEPQHVVVARDRRWIEALPPGPKAAYKHFVYQTGEDEFESLPEFDVLPQEAWVRREARGSTPARRRAPNAQAAPLTATPLCLPGRAQRSLHRPRARAGPGGARGFVHVHEPQLRPDDVV